MSSFAERLSYKVPTLGIDPTLLAPPLVILCLPEKSKILVNKIFWPKLAHQTVRLYHFTKVVPVDDEGAHTAY